MKDTYLNDLIGELSGIELDTNIVDSNSSASHVMRTLRASKYSPFTNPSYESFMRALVHKTLAEIQLLDDNQRSRVIALLEKHKDEISEASISWRKYYDKPQNAWMTFNLVTELCNHFSINTNHIIWLVEADPARDKTDFLEDLQNALSCKFRVATWLINELNGVTSKLESSTSLDSQYNVFNPFMRIEDAKKWFMQLAINKNKNSDPFLSPEQVEIFVSRAFGGVSFNEKISINAPNGDKANVIGLFHKFYVYCTTHQPQLGKIDKDASHDKYINLLTDHFDNWTFEEVKNNFRVGGNWTVPAN